MKFVGIVLKKILILDEVGRNYRHILAWIAVAQEGRETLPLRDLCSMHTPEGWPLKHQQMKRCYRNTQMWWRNRDIAIASQYKEATLSLTGEDGAECIKGVETFKILGRILDRSDDDWTVVLWNVGKTHRVWNHLGDLLHKKGGGAMHVRHVYQAVVQLFLLLGGRPRFYQRRCTESYRGLTWISHSI